MRRASAGCRRRVPRLVSSVLAGTALLVATGVGDASAHAAVPSSGPGCQTVHAGPQLAAGNHESYFRVTAGAGATRHQRVLVANPEPYPCSVTLEAASGETAVNSGDTYPVTGGHCVETGCWLVGLPATVSIPPHGRLGVSFGITVPAGTTGGEYLAGVVVRPTDPATTPSSRNDKQVSIAVTARVAIGVAVVVPGPLHPLLTITSVTLDASGATPLLSVHVRNIGNTWEHPTGGTVIKDRTGERGYAVRASTILAGDVATLPLPIAGVSRGHWPTEVVLHYGADQQAVWRGNLGYPTTTAVTGAAGTGAHTLPATERLPAWVGGIIAALALLVILLAVFLVVLYRRRRDHDSEPRPEGGHDIRPPIDRGVPAEVSVR